MIQKGVPVNTPLDGEFGVENSATFYFKGKKVTALHKSCLEGRAFCVKSLLDNGADANARYREIIAIVLLRFLL